MRKTFWGSHANKAIKKAWNNRKVTMHIKLINTHKCDATWNSGTHLEKATNRMPWPIQNHRFICTSLSPRNTTGKQHRKGSFFFFFQSSMRKRNNRKKRHSQRKQPFTVPQQTKPSNRSTQAIKINNKGNNKCRQRVSFGRCLEFFPCNVCNLCTVARWCVLGQLPESTGWKLLRRVYLEQLTHGTLPRVNNRCAGWNASWPAFKVGTSQMLLPLAQGNSWVKMQVFFFFFFC